VCLFVHPSIFLSLLKDLVVVNTPILEYKRQDEKSQHIYRKRVAFFFLVFCLCLSTTFGLFVFGLSKKIQTQIGLWALIFGLWDFGLWSLVFGAWFLVLYFGLSPCYLGFGLGLGLGL
jgi:hypothetical protein